VAAAPPPPQPVPDVVQNAGTIEPFSKQFQWTPHAFDNPNISYEILCPHGGAGGLICCAYCTSYYSKYLSKSVKDMETQRIANLGSEVKDLLQFTKDAKAKLSDATKAARLKPVPTADNGGSATKTAVGASQLKDPPASSMGDGFSSMKTAII